MKFKIFGKSGCDLCEKRYNAIKSYIEKLEAKGGKCELEYISVDEPDGMVEFSMLDGVNEIPYVLFEKENFSRNWNGTNEYPTAREVFSLFEDDKKFEAKGDVIMKARGEIKRYDTNFGVNKGNAIEDNRIN